MDIVAKGFMALCLLQTIAGYFYIFSLVQATGFVLMLLPFFGMHKRPLWIKLSLTSATRHVGVFYSGPLLFGSVYSN